MSTSRPVILITGASRGIGAEIARSLLTESVFYTGSATDWQGSTAKKSDSSPPAPTPMVILTARNEDALQEVCSEHPGRCHAIAADLATAEGRRHLVTRLGQILKTESGHLSGLVNNAGFLKAVPFLELTEEDWNAHYRVNLLAPALLVKELAPLFGPDGGHIVNISSMGGFQGSRKFPGLSAYSAMKGALAILTESMAAELNGKNLCVNALCLGAVQTEMLEEAFPGFQAPVQPDRMGRWIAEFLVHGHRLFNGKILPVSLTDPQ